MSEVPLYVYAPKIHVHWVGQCCFGVSGRERVPETAYLDLRILVHLVKNDSG